MVSKRCKVRLQIYLTPLFESKRLTVIITIDIKSFIKQIKNIVFIRWALQYIEVHLVDHCNLICDNCTYYSPYTPNKFADFSQFQKDFTRLSEICMYIRQIKILGGEPLLNPDIAQFLHCARSLFPDAPHKHMLLEAMCFPVRYQEKLKEIRNGLEKKHNLIWRYDL